MITFCTSMLHKTTILFMLIVGLAFILSSCSSEVEDVPEEDVDAYSESDQINEDYDYSPEDDGWRPGVLSITFSMHQIEEVSDPNEDLLINGEIDMQATSTQDVWIAPDLSLVPTWFNDPDEIRAAYESRPYQSGEDTTPAKVSGKITYRYQQNIKSLGSEEQVHGEGSINGLNISNMNHSLLGVGYELDLGIIYTLVLNKKITVDRMGSSSEEYSVTDPIEFKLRPTPDRQRIDSYPYSEIEIEYNRKQQDLESLVVYKNELPGADKVLLHGFSVGAITQLSKDKLSIRYQYKGAKWIPMIPGLPYGPAKDTILDISVTLSAK